MAWKAYEVIFRVRGPLHIGWGKVGNVQRTRPYVTGRALWGALTMRLTRDGSQGPATNSGEYEKVGKEVHDNLAFTYFYPALELHEDQQDKHHYKVMWPWEDEAAFRRRLLSSYQSTALTYPAQSAAEATLHEVEFIAPRTLDTGEQVFLKGYVFEKNGSNLQWQTAFDQLQIGGERGYGWGKVELAECPREIKNGAKLFNQLDFDGSKALPCVSAPVKTHLLAHTSASDTVKIAGQVEPLVGREWQTYPGERVACNGIYFLPGSRLEEDKTFAIEPFGVWKG